MLQEAADGFCMALADSVPGVSGGTVAFIMGFYDRFIGSIHDLVFEKKEKRKKAALFMIQLGVGWLCGMILAIVLLSSLFESHIYIVSSLFIGFILGAIPVVIAEEKESMKHVGKGIGFLAAGLVLVVALTYLNGRTGHSSLDLSHFSIGLGLRLFFTAAVSITAMFLPGISGSTMLLVFGVYLPVMTALRGLIGLDGSYLPSLLFFLSGGIVGALCVVKLIKVSLEKFRPQMIYLIVGMMAGSVYSIIMGPSTLSSPKDPLSWASFNVPAFLAGMALVLLMEVVKREKLKESLQ